MENTQTDKPSALMAHLTITTPQRWHFFCLLKRWMDHTVLNMTKISNNEVSTCASNPYGPKGSGFRQRSLIWPIWGPQHWLWASDSPPAVQAFCLQEAVNQMKGALKVGEPFNQWVNWGCTDCFELLITQSYPSRVQQSQSAGCVLVCFCLSGKEILISASSPG